MTQTQASSGAIEALLQEDRRFPPVPELAAKANIRDVGVYEVARRDPEAFWAERAREQVEWFKPWERVLEWNPPFAKWFVGAELNASYNCVDRHANGARADKAAIIWESEPGEVRTITYRQLLDEVNLAAATLRRLGVKKGDKVAIYLPMIPELPVAMLACARLGAPHTVVFGGFSPESLADRINDCQASFVITADGGWRRGNVVPLKKNTDAALQQTSSVKQCLVVRRVGEATEITMEPGRDIWWHEALEETRRSGQTTCEPEAVDAEHPLYILYTSGSTGKPKGILHTTGGYLVGTSLTHKWIFDLKEDDIYWCTADIGWVTGHSYIVYGPLCNGATTLMFEGTPDFPDRDRFWAVVAKHKVTILYTAPTAIRSFMRWGEEYPNRHDMSSLRLLGTVGEPINPEAWVWYHKTIGGGRCPVVDTWWQTETGMIMISPLPGITTAKPGSATFPFPGVDADVVDEQGNSVPLGGGGYLVLRKPWPAMLRTLWGDDERFIQTYWSKFPGIYFTGDGCKRDDEGYFWLLGRVDDVLNVSAHRIGTMELESALVSHPSVAEAAVIGVPDPITGQAIAAFVTPRMGVNADDTLSATLREHVAQKIGPIARPKVIRFTTELPKTRSGKIMRRLLRDIAEGRVLGDTTTLLDPSVLTDIKQQYEAQET
ncbi:MAG TPA: acetate--CoA ligase [Chloroflexota bacterium]|nr:acetate--CoA ligase [Chloroflexota bacterium]